MTPEGIDAFALREGMPPSAANVVLVDFDKTIRPWGDLLSTAKPITGAAEGLRRLHANGYHIVILTSRVSPSWWLAEAARRNVNVHTFGREQAKYVKAYLKWYDIPYDEITAEKLPALVLFDDTAVRVSEDYPLGQAITDFLKARGQA